MKLTRADLDYIRLELHRRGVVDAELFNELVDHISCEVELAMKQGTTFKKAFEKVLYDVRPNELTTLQNKVIQAHNYNTPIMIINTWKITLRHLRKHSMHAAINVAGLALGLTCFI